MQIAEQTANTTQKAVGHTAGVYFERRPVALPIRRSMHGSAKFLDSFGNPLDANQEEWLVEFVNTSAKLFSSYPEGLISQAPAMLEAFEELTNEASDNLENIGLPHDKAMLMLALIDNARATIARAKGEVQS